MIQVRVKSNSTASRARTLRFETSLEFPLLLKKIASKLGVSSCSTCNEKDNETNQQDEFQLYLGGDVLVQDTSEIDEGDELVLVEYGKEPIIPKKSPRKNKSDTLQSLIGKRVAKHFYVDLQQGDTTQIFLGTVTEYFEPLGVWRIRYDDGDSEDMARKDLQNALKLYKQNKHLDEDIKTEQRDLEANSDKEDIQDVTDEMLEKREAKKEVIECMSASSDDEEEEEEAVLSEDDFEENYESSSENESDASSFHGDEDCSKREDAKLRARKRKRKEPKESSLEVLISPKDMPSAPGTKPGDIDYNGHLEESSTLFTKGGAADDIAVKQRVMKLLNTGFHENSNEHEAKNAMKLAQRLMRKHNLSQAMLLRERDAKEKGGEHEEILKGGMVKVSIVYRKTQRPAQFSRWISRLVHPLGKNFTVKSFHQICRGYECKVTFYGIYTNCQLAAYAFKVATERISLMMTEYEPVKSPWDYKKVSTKSARISYALGIVRGIDQEVDATIRREKEHQQRKLEQARQAVSKGEAYEESEDDDDNDEDDGGRVFSFPEKGSAGAGTENADELKTGSLDEGPDADLNSLDDPLPTTPASVDTPRSKTAPSRILTGSDLQSRLEEMEKEEEAAIVLVDHRQKVAEQVLKDRNIKLSRSRKQRPIAFDRRSYDRGIIDAKEIDINQRAIRDEVKVKNEKRR